MRSADDSISPKPPFYLQFLRCSHIDKGEEAIDIHHEVFWLEISIDDSIGVKVLHHEEDLPNELTCMLGAKGYDFGDHVEEILALNELQDEVDEVAVFDQLMEAYDVGGFGDSAQDLLLVHYVLDYLGFLDVGAVEDFDCVDLLGLGVPASVDLAEVALSELADYVEIRYLHLLLQEAFIFLVVL